MPKAPSSYLPGSLLTTMPACMGVVLVALQHKASQAFNLMASLSFEEKHALDRHCLLPSRFASDALYSKKLDIPSKVRPCSVPSSMSEISFCSELSWLKGCRPTCNKDNQHGGVPDDLNSSLSNRLSSAIHDFTSKACNAMGLAWKQAHGKKACLPSMGSSLLFEGIVHPEACIMAGQDQPI